MIRSISIRNFRGFKSVDLDDCRRINILVGENGSGKTAFLEGLFLALGASPELALRTRAWRGSGETKVSGSLESIHRALFEDLFYRMQLNNAAVISLKGSERQENRAVTIKYFAGGKRLVPPPRSRPSAGPSVDRVPPIQFEWKIDGAIEFSASAELRNERVVFPPTPASIIQAVFLAAHRAPTSIETVERFSALSRTFMHEKFIARFSKLYPHITDISVEFLSGNVGLFAKVRDLPEKIPLNLASGGMSKLAMILLSMSSSENGVILLDEIESGFYYKNLRNVWEAILEFSRQYNCQVFASTHSAECLDAVAELAEADPKEFGVLHSYWRDSEVRILQYDGNKFVSALADDLEIR